MLSEDRCQPDADYDAFEHLCDVVFPDDEDGLMFYWKAHFDASGKDGPVLVVAGYLSERPQWKTFNKTWKTVLTTGGRTDIFHATDFESGQKAFAVEHGWPPTRRAAVRTALVNALDSSGIKLGVVSSVIVKDYEDAIRGWRRQIYGDVYEFLVSQCLHALAVFFQRVRQPDPIAFIIEDGEGSEGKIQDAFLRTYRDKDLRELLRFGSLSFLPKDQAVGLQAADMLANYYLNHLSGTLPNTDSHRRIIESPSRPLLVLNYDKEFFDRMDRLQNRGQMVSVSPEVAFKYRKPPTVAIKVRADFNEAEEVLSELDALMETFPDLAYSLVKDSASVAKLFSIETQNELTAGANNLRVSFKPNDFAFERIAALRTLNRERELGE